MSLPRGRASETLAEAQDTWPRPAEGDRAMSAADAAAAPAGSGPPCGREHRSEWQAIGASVRGAFHVRAGLPNQDAICWLPGSGAGPPLVLAVADGHGSAKCFRSNVGASLAVDTATKVIQDLLHRQSESASLSEIERAAADLVHRWTAAVEDHLRESPLAIAELDSLEQKDGAAARQAVETNPLLAYGTTISAVLLAEAFILYLQLGDGDILTVSDGGEVTRPLSADERLFADETTSLCSRRARHDFRMGLQSLSGGPGGLPSQSPALILLSTDGYANSFRDEEGFRKVGSDLLELTRSDGLDVVKASLAHWLDEASQFGSGDDITLGIVCRLDTLHRPAIQLPPELSIREPDEGPGNTAEASPGIERRDGR